MGVAADHGRSLGPGKQRRDRAPNGHSDGNPMRLHARRSRVPLLLFCICASVMARTTANAQTIRPEYYVTNGPVRALTLSGGTLYVGGSFSQVGPATGPGLPLGSADGRPLAGFPKIAGGL